MAKNKNILLKIDGVSTRFSSAEESQMNTIIFPLGLLLCLRCIPISSHGHHCNYALGLFLWAWILFLFYFNLSSVITLWQNERNLLFLLQKQNHGTTMAFFPIRASVRNWNLHNPLELCLGITNQSSFNRSADCTVLCFQPLASPCSRPLCAALLCPWELCWPPHRRPGIPTSPSINKEQLTRRLPLFLPIH